MLGKNIKEGMVVRTSDGEKLGKIVRADADSFLIEKGLLFKKDFLANYDEILDIEGDDVWLKGSRDQILTRGETSTTATSTEGYRGESTMTSTEERSIPLSEERLEAEKHTRSAGEVTVGKRVVTEQKEISVPVVKEEVFVERVPAGEMRTGENLNAEGRFEETTTRIPVREEEVEIKKRPVVREEVRVGKRSRVEEVRAADTVRREEADIKKEGDVDLERGSNYKDPDKF